MAFYSFRMSENNFMQTLLVFVLLLASSSQAKKEIIEKVNVKPGSCSFKIPVDDPDKEYELSVETNDCVACRDKETLCGRSQPITCKIYFQPESIFIKSSMTLCADTKEASISMCRNKISMGSFSSLLNCYQRPSNEKYCRDLSERPYVIYTGFNFCMFKGSYRIYTEPLYYQLTYDCPHGYRRRITEKVISFDYHQLYARNRLCRVYLRPPIGFTSDGMCIKFQHADFAKNGPTMYIRTSSISFETWKFNSENRPILNFLYCDYGASGFSVYLKEPWEYMNVLKRLEHRVIFTYKFRGKQIVTSLGDDHNSEYEDDDSDKGLRPEYIALGVIGFIFVIGCCCCCNRRRMFNNNDSEAENTEGCDENEPFQENGDTASMRYRPNMDTPVVHDIVRGAIPALNSQNSPQTSRSASPLSYARSNIPPPVYPQEEHETSIQLQPSTPPQLQDSAAPPPSYESLFPTQADNT